MDESRFLDFQSRWRTSFDATFSMGILRKRKKHNTIIDKCCRHASMVCLHWLADLDLSPLVFSAIALTQFDWLMFSAIALMTDVDLSPRGFSNLWRVDLNLSPMFSAIFDVLIWICPPCFQQSHWLSDLVFVPYAGIDTNAETRGVFDALYDI